MTQVNSLYLHVPFCIHLCNYCDFYKRRLDPLNPPFDSFHQFLRESVKRNDLFFREQNVSWATLDTIYLGGGTPSLWGKEGADFFQREVLPLPLGPDAEFTMEIDPGTWSDEMLDAWKDIGLNRISIGTQSLNPEFLKILDRVHSAEDTVNFLAKLKKENWNYSLDFLLGVPFSREKNRDIIKELRELLDFNPKHISLYILNARSKYPLIQNIPDDDYIREEYLLVSEFLKAQGFLHYEVSNFSLPGHESKHNLKYWRGESVAALGPTGTGYLANSSDKATRYKWKVTHPEIEIESLGEKELNLERLYLSLRTSDGILMVDGLECLAESWTKQNYAILKDHRIHLTSLGFLMLDSLMDDLFRWEKFKKDR